MLTICTFWWGDKYPIEYVFRLFDGVSRHLKQPHRFLVMTEREREVLFGPPIERHAIKDPELTKIPGCFARLRVFDTGWQANRNIGPEDRVVWLDLDAIIVGDLDTLFDRPEPLVVLSGVNASNPCPYNCSVVMFRGGAHPELWEDFRKIPWTTEELSRAIPHFKFPDDQGWLWHRAPEAARWTVADGIYGFQKPGWPKDGKLPENARIVCFPGWRDPKMFTDNPWVQQHWLRDSDVPRPGGTAPKHGSG